MTGSDSSGGGADGGAPGDRFALAAYEPTGIQDAIDVTFGDFGGFGGVEWAVPAFTLVVPGVLLIMAVGAQALVSALWLPFVRRWVGGVGGRRRQRA